jgi:hypothetical protein
MIYQNIPTIYHPSNRKVKKTMFVSLFQTPCSFAMLLPFAPKLLSSIPSLKQNADKNKTFIINWKKNLQYFEQHARRLSLLTHGLSSCMRQDMLP